jgi:hypothetical protein
MLFLLHEGTPSVAKTINLHSGPQTDIPPDVAKKLKKNSAARSGGSLAAIIALYIFSFIF